jgi:hypothetical protein
VDFRRLAIAGVLLGTLVWGFYTSPLTKRFFQKKQPVARARVQAPLQAQASTSAARGEAPRLALDELAAWRARFAHAWDRDPFFTAQEEQALRAPKVASAPVQRASAPLPSYTVKAVVISDSAKVATIDGRLVSEGEMLGEERVVEIQPDGVILERAGQRRRIEIAGGAVRLIEVEPRSGTKER